MARKSNKNVYSFRLTPEAHTALTVMAEAHRLFYQSPSLSRELENIIIDAHTNFLMGKNEAERHAGRNT
jgi:hypothetical protein